MFPIWGAFPAFRCRSGWIVVVPVNDGAWWLLRCDSAPVVRWSGGPVRKCTAVKGVVLWAGAEVKARSYGCDEWLGPSGACTDWVSLVILRGRERGWSFLVFSLSSFLFDIHLQVPYFTDLCKMFLYSVVYQTHSDTCLVFLYLIRSPLHWSSIFLSKWTLGSAALWLAGTLMVQNIGVVLQKGLVMGEHLEGRYKEGVVWWLWWRHWEVTSVLHLHPLRPPQFGLLWFGNLGICPALGTSRFAIHPEVMREFLPCLASLVWAPLALSISSEQVSPIKEKWELLPWT